MAKASDTANDEPIVVKKYANRRLYDTQTSTYVTLEDLAVMVKDERDFIVIDAKSKEDITHSVLTQIILERETKGEHLLPPNFLRQLIRFYGHSMQKFVPGYLELSLGELTKQQEKYREQIGDAFAGTPLNLMQEQTKKNMEMFEKAMSMFAPFPSKTTDASSEEKCAAEEKATPSRNSTKSPARKSAAKSGARSKKSAASANNDSDSEQLEDLKSQLDALQNQISKLTR